MESGNLTVASDDYRKEQIDFMNTNPDVIRGFYLCSEFDCSHLVDSHVISKVGFVVLVDFGSPHDYFLRPSTSCPLHDLLPNPRVRCDTCTPRILPSLLCLPHPLSRILVLGYPAVPALVHPTTSH